MANTNRLAGKTALITGGTSGIGLASVELFIGEGAKVAFTGRSERRGNELERRFPGQAYFIAADVSREQDVARAVSEAYAWCSGLDVLFNNAGEPPQGGVETLTYEQFHRAMDVLLGSVLFGIKYAAPLMKARGRGAIINNASIASLRTHMGGYLYSIAKAAVTHATRLAGMELGKYGITVNSISPGGIPTPIFFGGSRAMDQIDPAEKEQKLEALRGRLDATTPLLHCGTPRDIAYAALFLASDEGAYINCHDLVVDGGTSAAGRNEFRPPAKAAPISQEAKLDR